MLQAFARTFVQLSDPAFRRPLLVSLGLTLAVFIGLWVAMWFLLTRTSLFDLIWLDWAVDALGGLATIGLTFVLFPGVAASILALFLEQAVAAVEARHYPDLPAPRSVPLIEQGAIALRFLATAVVLNLIFLPLYFIPGVNAVAFFGLNGYLLGREYFELVAPRRLAPAEVRELYRSRRIGVFLAGVGFALAALVPVANLFAPVLAAGTMTHLFEGWRRARAASAKA